RRFRFGLFYQAEDGIRVRNVTGVQTCALPISNNGRKLSSNSLNNEVAIFFISEGRAANTSCFHLLNSPSVRSLTCAIFKPPANCFNNSGFNRVPWQTGHVE